MSEVKDASSVVKHCHSAWLGLGHGGKVGMTVRGTLYGEATNICEKCYARWKDIVDEHNRWYFQVELPRLRKIEIAKLQSRIEELKRGDC